ncbi:MAG: hypothetical protein M3220_12465 [Chloroflexota bacterium]|nr:hypothetical protein [Chloroflexota bacterium]
MGQGVLGGTLLWTNEGPRAVETVQPGSTLVAFDPAAFVRTSVILRRAQPRHTSSCIELLVGGRLLLAAPEQHFVSFTVDGRWTTRAARDLRPEMLLPVNRHVPVSSKPISLPDLDSALTQLLGEDALALADAIYEREKYFEEMGKRRQRLKLFELSGYLLSDAEVLGDNLLIVDRPRNVVGYYTDIFQHTFGRILEDRSDIPLLTHRLHRWMGEGLHPAPLRALPAWAWKLEGLARAAFLRGFFDVAGEVSEQAVTMRHPSRRLVSGVQALLGMLGVEATIALVEEEDVPYQLTIRNVRRFAEWVNSNDPAKAGVLRAVYRREPRYPPESCAMLPLNKVRPVLARLRATYQLPRHTSDTVDERDAAAVSTLRLLATAFHDVALRELVNQQLYLEPITSIRVTSGGTAFALHTHHPKCVITNGVVIG